MAKTFYLSYLLCNTDLNLDLKAYNLKKYPKVNLDPLKRIFFRNQSVLSTITIVLSLNVQIVRYYIVKIRGLKSDKIQLKNKRVTIVIIKNCKLLVLQVYTDLFGVIRVKTVNNCKQTATSVLLTFKAVHSFLCR